MLWSQASVAQLAKRFGINGKTLIKPSGSSTPRTRSAPDSNATRNNVDVGLTVA